MDWEKEGQGSGEYIVYPEGTYKITINGYERVTARTGTPQIRWKASILEGEYIGKNITTHTPLTEKSLWKVARLVKACGVDLKTLGKMDTDSKAFNTALSKCIRRSAYWHLSVGLDNKGEQRNEVDDFKLDPDQSVPEEEVPEFLKNS